ncbi:hypothetical protein ACQV2T_06755 [Facklamia sp. P13069]|uniref:hypothetical protein n=1 Tax=Facklamia sp. P13069 TaxID=3421954 RepID=UPI003D1856C3
MTLQEFLYEHNLDMVYDLIYRYGQRHGYFEGEEGEITTKDDDIEVVSDPRALLDF